MGPERSQPRGPFGPCPRTPKGLPFLVRRKGSKRLFRGIPPKDPQGERSGRVPLAPTAGFLSGSNKHIESQQVRSQYRKNSTLCKGSYVIVQLPGRLIRLFRARTVRNPRLVTCLYFALTGQGGIHARGLTAQCLPEWIPERATHSAALCARRRRALFRKCEGISEPVDPPNPSIGPQAHRVALLRA